MEYSIISQLPAFYSPVYIGNTERFVCYTEQTPLSTKEITSLHFHKCLEIGVCTSGSGNCIIDNRLYRYKKAIYKLFYPINRTMQMAINPIKVNGFGFLTTRISLLQMMMLAIVLLQS